MWPWSKFKQYEVEIDRLRHEIALRDGQLVSLESKLKRMTDRDSRGRFKK